MNWIGNTAEYGTSGLDEGQAAGLLSAVGEAGLSLVEPGPTSDPVAAGLKAAISRCHDAWLETQPQLFWRDEDLYGLEEGDVSRAETLPGCGVVFLEPVASPLVDPGHGLTSSGTGDPATCPATGSGPPECSTPVHGPSRFNTNKGSAATLIPERAADPRRSV